MSDITPNVEAKAVNTVAWLTTQGIVFAVPVYQRHYVWDERDCEKLLRDILEIADKEGTHFIGSILSKTSPKSEDGVAWTEYTLIDGQQRIFTLSLLIAALYHVIEKNDVKLAQKLSSMLHHPVDETRTKLIPYQGREKVFEEIVFDRSFSETNTTFSNIQPNYHFFKKQIVNCVDKVWKGLQKLEHVAVILNEGANPQQIFASLNTTGKPLDDSDLIHNHILMALDRRKQEIIEENIWKPIENNARKDDEDKIEDFWFHYLLLKTGKYFARGDFGIYETFREQFRESSFETIKEAGKEWIQYSESYYILLNPVETKDKDIALHLAYVNQFGTGTYPFLMAVYNDFRNKKIDKSTLIEVLKLLQSLYTRRAVWGFRERFPGIDSLYQKVKKEDYLRSIQYALLSNIPMDNQVTEALKSRSLPVANYILECLERQGNTEAITDFDDIQIEHIFPRNPDVNWSPDGKTLWSEMEASEQDKMKARLDTLGNLTLLSAKKNINVSNKPYHDKVKVYKDSGFRLTRNIEQEFPKWDVESIERRTDLLTKKFLEIWERPNIGIEFADEEWISILDVVIPTGQSSRYEKQFAYVKIQDAILPVLPVGHGRDLTRLIFQELWKTHKEEVLSIEQKLSKEYSGSSLIILQNEKSPKKIYTPLDDKYCLYLGWVPRYLVEWTVWCLQGLDLADQCHVKYAANKE